MPPQPQVILMSEQVWHPWTRSLAFWPSSGGFTVPTEQLRAPPWKKGAGVSTQAGSRCQNNSHPYLFLHLGNVYKHLQKMDNGSTALKKKSIYTALQGSL